MFRHRRPIDDTLLPTCLAIGVLEDVRGFDIPVAHSKVVDVVKATGNLQVYWP